MNVYEQAASEAGRIASNLGLGHQPRERAVTCAVCGRLTWHPHGTCPEHTETCEQCCVPGSLEVTR